MSEGNVRHVLPVNDLIEHEHVPTDNGDGWVIVHNSLDGRELHEEEPDG